HYTKNVNACWMAVRYDAFALSPKGRSMSPEEINRTIEFIIQSQARQAVAQEQDRERRFELQALTLTMAELVKHQSSRVDRYDEWMRGATEAHRNSLDQILRLLHMIMN